MSRFLLSLLAVLLIVAAVLAAAFVLYYQPQTKELEGARQGRQSGPGACGPKQPRFGPRALAR